MKRTNSAVNLALNALSPEEPTTTLQPSSGDIPHRVRSTSNLAALLVETSNVADINRKEEDFLRSIGKEQGFDLKKIRSHYEHRRHLRSSKLVLRYGELLPLAAKNEQSETQGPHSFLSNVLAFARFSLMETAIVTINLSDSVQKCYVDNSKLKTVMSQGMNLNSIVMVQNILDPKD